MVREKHNPKRRNILAESRLVSEYLAERYKGEQWFIHLRMGPVPVREGVDLTDPGAAMLARGFNRWADAVVATSARIIIIEAKMWDPSTAIGKLREYMLLARATPELLPFAALPLVGEIVTAQDDPLGALVIRQAGLQYVYFPRPWIEDFYAVYPLRRRRSPTAPVVEELRALADAAPLSENELGG